MSKRGAAIFRAAGLTDTGAGLHWLRSTPATGCLASGMSVDATMWRLGHKAVQTMMKHYTNVRDSEQRDVLDRLALDD